MPSHESLNQDNSNENTGNQWNALSNSQELDNQFQKNVEQNRSDTVVEAGDKAEAIRKSREKIMGLFKKSKENSPDSKDESVEDAAEKPKKSAAELAHWWAERVSEASIGEMAAHETTRVRLALSSVDRISKKAVSERTKEDKKKYEERVSELKRYGYDQYGVHTSIFATIERAVESSSHQAARSVAKLERERAAQFKEVQMYLEGDNGKAVTKALKKAGFKKLPEKWDDKDFTSEEISRIHFIASVHSDGKFDAKSIL